MKLSAAKYFFATESAFEPLQHRIRAAIASHACAVGRRGEAACRIGPGGLQRPDTKEEPPIIGTAPWIIGGRRQAGLGEGSGEIGTERRPLRTKTAPWLSAGTLPIGLSARYSGDIIVVPNSRNSIRYARPTSSSNQRAARPRDIG